MSKVVAIMSMSLDGFVADPDDGVAEVFDWYVNSGAVEIHTGGSDPMTFRMSESSAEHFRDLTSRLGAVLTGRRTFEVADGWGGNHHWGPAFVLTHEVPDGWPRPAGLWRRELRNQLMGELRRTGWVTYNRTPRSLRPGGQGRGLPRTPVAGLAVSVDPA